MDDSIYITRQPEVTTISHDLFTNIVDKEAIRYLSINYCNITKVPPRLIGELFPNLTYLSLIGNKIYKIESDAFVSLHKLETLILDENDISTIEKTAFNNLCKLETLSLHNNKLSIIPTVNVHQLRFLTLSNNVITHIPDYAFSKLHLLRTLCISSNVIEQIGCWAFVGLRQLRSLRIAFNRLSSVHDDTFRYTPHLICIDLSYNPRLFVMPDCFNMFTKQLMVCGFNEHYYQYRTHIESFITNTLIKQRAARAKEINDSIKFDMSMIDF